MSIANRQRLLIADDDADMLREQAGASPVARGGHDWTNKLKSLASEVEKLGITEAWLDGELMVFKDGLPDFNALQRPGWCKRRHRGTVRGSAGGV